MNASYNKLVTKHLPKARIVYDRFHMQSQFGRDVLGAVRLDEARRHKAKELDGFNNKIKVAKRIVYGYRDDDFFFTLIRYLSIPSVRSPSHKKS